MSRILSLIEDKSSGSAWEKLCVDCYRLRYQDDHYTPIPAVPDGDAGIEGFTSKGVAHQSYGPERYFSDTELYEHLRSKLTKDIGKLKKNAARLNELGVPPIVEWHFNIPEYRDNRIIKHAQKKRLEVLKAKKANPDDYTHIEDNFNIYIKTAENFSVEISRLLRLDVTDTRIDFNSSYEDTPDWTKCDSEKTENIRRKISAVMLVTDNTNDALNKVVDIFIRYYIGGIEHMNRLRADFADVHARLFELEQSYKRDVSVKTLMHTEQTLNKQIFDGILSDFQLKLEQEFSGMFAPGTIVDLKNDLVAKWLADCDMEFRSV